MTTRLARASVALTAALMLVPLLDVLRSPDAVIPGALGDNVSFLWNTWWAPAFWRGGANWRTALLFAPWGTSLLLHTHTLLPSTLAAAIAPAHPVLGTNLVVSLHLVLNGLCAYALAFRVTRSAAAATIGAIAFGWCPYVGAHLAGHFNLIAAWTLPLMILLALRALEGKRVADAVVLGAALGLTGYVDYYYAVYAAGVLALLFASRIVFLTVVMGPLGAWPRRTLVICAVLLLIDCAFLAVIGVTGGGTFHVGPIAVSARGVENPAAAAGLPVMIALAVSVGPRIRARYDREAAAAVWRTFLLACAVALILTAPLLAAGLSLWRSGGYVTQTYLWRSSPAGIDLATLVLGNPEGLSWWGLSLAAYRHFNIDIVERVAWLGPGLLGLCAAALASSSSRKAARVYAILAVVFGVWALGPRLQAFGHDLHVFLPGVLVRYVPLASNARMPGRAIVVVYLALAMLAAIGADALLRARRRPAFAVLAALLVLDFLPKPITVYRPGHPAIYETLARQDGPGAVCELPMGLRDGFGETGRFDMRLLSYQMVHGRPMTGGFVARLDPRLLRAYERDPVLGVLLALSAGASPSSVSPLSRSEAGAALRAAGIRFVMLNRETAPPDLMRYVASGLPLRAIAEEGARELYEVSPPVTASSEPPRR